jgi:hypothetical protein
MTSFTEVFQDGVIQVVIDDQGYAVLAVIQIKDDGVVVRAINRAVKAGATRATMLTGDITNDRLARAHRTRAERGTTWLGGAVTRLADGELGPQFRIDWDVLPTITE